MRRARKNPERSYLPHIAIGVVVAGVAYWLWSQSKAPVASPLPPPAQAPPQPLIMTHGEASPMDFLPPPAKPPTDTMTPLDRANAALIAVEARIADPTLSSAEHDAAVASQATLRSKIAELAAPAVPR